MTSLKAIFASIFGWTALAAALFLIVPGQAEANTITAAGVNLASVSAAVALAADGDTVIVPAGTAHWASGLSITKGITLIGATTCDTSTALGAANDQTIIVDDNTTVLSSPNQIINVNLSPNQVFRMSGFTFRGGTGNLSNAFGVIVLGTCPGASGTGSFRIDHCHYDSLNRNVDLQTEGWVYGVIDHCILTGSGEAVNVHHSTWGGGSNDYGDGSWAEPPYFGSSKFVFIENNCFNNTSSDGSTGGIDSKNGGRWVARYNFFNNAIAGSHGTEGQRPRGARAIEVYNNVSNYTFAFPGGQLRSGTAVIHDNHATGQAMRVAMNRLQPYRFFASFGNPWFGATGTNPWDVNDLHGAYDSGTQNGPTSSAGLQDNTKNWTTNQWTSSNAGVYVALDTSTGKSSYIISNTSNTLTVATYTPGVTYNTGDSYTIYRVLVGIDQPGRGAGDLVSGATPVNTAQNNRAAFPRNALEPVFGWNNVVDASGGSNLISGDVPLIENRDFYNRAPQSGDAIFPYTPYTYPHPLVSGASPSTPSAPKNLRVTGP